MKPSFSIVASLAAFGIVVSGSIPGCGGTDRSGGGRLLDGGSGGADSGVVPVQQLVGSKCAQDSDCAKGLICATVASNDMIAGGPAHGVCTADCSASATACASVDRNSICVSFNRSGSVSYCLQKCVLGAPARGAVKCQGRSDMACADSGNGDGTGYCAPTCRGDFDCSGRVCDLSSGLCTDPSKIVGTKPIGSPCDPKSLTEVCKGGFCLTLPGGGGTCSGFCAIGSAGCGETLSATTLDAYCLFTFDPTVTDVGDQGFCGQLCDCDSDCRDPGSVCAPDQTLQRPSGHSGYCTPKMSGGSVVPGTPCGTPDAGASSDSGRPRTDSGASSDAARG